MRKSGYTRVETERTDWNDIGFRAVLFENEETGEAILAYAGTDDWMDRWTSFKNAFGLETQQYQAGVELVNRYKDVFRGRLTLVGHSLGGGIASVAALVYNLPSVTYNAAGVSPLVVERMGGIYGMNRAAELIDAYRVDGEILSTLQDVNQIDWGSAVLIYVYGIPAVLFVTATFLAPDGVGNKILLDGNSWDPISRHNMGVVIAGIEKQVWQAQLNHKALVDRLKSFYETSGF